MASSKGLGLKGRDVKSLLPPELARFLFCRTDYRQAVEFDPVGTMAIPDLFDEYDRCYRAFIEASDETLARTFEMSQIGELPKKEKTFLPRFRDVVNYVQMANVDVLKKFEEIKGASLNGVEQRLLEERVIYAKVWTSSYAPEEFRLQMSGQLPEKAKELTEQQKGFLKEVVSLVKEKEDPEELQLALYNLAKKLGVDVKKSFSAIYIALIGKEFGPKAAWFLLQYPKEEVIKRLEEASG